MIVRDPRATWKYVLESDRRLPRDEQTVFELKHLTLADEHRTLDNLDRDSFGVGIRRESGSEHLALLRKYLAGWSGLKRADGTEVTFDAPKGQVRDDLLFLLPLRVREELALAIEHEVVFEPVEVGKSEPPST